MAATASQQRAASSRYKAETRTTSDRAPTSVTGRSRSEGSILTRIALPVFLALVALAALSQSAGTLALVVFAAAWVVLGLAALTAGHDSREPSGWTRKPVQH
jgi:hypothetical protein